MNLNKTTLSLRRLRVLYTILSLERVWYVELQCLQLCSYVKNNSLKKLAVVEEN